MPGLAVLSFAISLDLGVRQGQLDPILGTRVMKGPAIGMRQLHMNLSRSPVTAPAAAHFALVGRLEVVHPDVDRRHALQTSRERYS